MRNDFRWYWYQGCVWCTGQRILLRFNWWRIVWRGATRHLPWFTGNYLVFTGNHNLHGKAYSGNTIEGSACFFIFLYSFYSSYSSYHFKREGWTLIGNYDAAKLCCEPISSRRRYAAMIRVSIKFFVTMAFINIRDTASNDFERRPMIDWVNKDDDFYNIVSQ